MKPKSGTATKNGKKTGAGDEQKEAATGSTAVAGGTATTGGTEIAKNTVADSAVHSQKKKKVASRLATPDRKKFKISTQISQPNRGAWQIKGFNIEGGLLGFYIQKSLNSGSEEQPFLRNLLSKLQRYPYLRQQELGILYIGTRVDEDGDQLVANAGHQDSEWHLFIASETDVGALQQWLDTVCNRLNEDDIAGNDKVFKWKVTFTVTSWGNDTATPKKLNEVIKHDEVVDIVIGLHNLALPHNRGKALDSLPLHNYFVSQADGKNAIKEHFDMLL